MVQRDMVLVGTAAPPAGLESYWVSSVLMEPTLSLTDTLQRALETGASGLVGSTIKIDFTGISAARIQHFEEIIQMLESSYIDPVGAVQ